MRLFVTLVLGLLALPGAAYGEKSKESEMRAFEQSGYQLTGAEYWVFVGSEPFRYPDDVQWGFYPDGASEKALECALTAFRELKDFLTADHAELREAKALGATRYLYLWVNDYTTADPERSRRKARLWHWNWGDHDYKSGYWKWESTLTQDGECLTPRVSAARLALGEAIDSLSRPTP